MLAGLAVLGIGCGGGDEGTASSSHPASPAARAKFAAAANRLCEKRLLEDERKATAVFRSKAKLYERNGTFDEFKGPVRRQEIAIVLAPSLRRRIGDVRALGIPAGDERRVEAILEAIDAAAKSAQENPFAFLTSGAPMKDARDLARSYGIESCAILYEPDGAFQKASAKPVNSA